MINQLDLDDIIRQFGANYPTWVKNGIGRDLSNIIKTLSSMDKFVDTDLIKSFDYKEDETLSEYIKESSVIDEQTTKTEKERYKLENKQFTEDKKHKKKEVEERRKTVKKIPKSFNRIQHSVTKTLSDLDRRDLDFADIMDSAGDATLMLSRKFASAGIVGKTLAILTGGIAALMVGYGLTLRYVNTAGKTFSELAASGVSFEGGLSGYFNTLTFAGQSIEDFGEVIKNNAKLFNYLGVSGSSSFAVLARSMLESSDKVRQYGMSLQDINEFLVLQLELDSFNFAKRTKIEEIQTFSMNKQLGIFTDYSYILGKSREEIIKDALQLNKEPLNVLLKAILTKQDPKSEERLKKVYNSIAAMFGEDAESAKKMNSIINAVSLGRYASGSIMTAETAEYRNILSSYAPGVLKAIYQLEDAGDDMDKLREAEAKMIYELLNFSKTPAFSSFVSQASMTGASESLKSMVELFGNAQNSFASFVLMNEEQIAKELKKRSDSTKNEDPALKYINNMQNMIAQFNDFVNTLYVKIISSKLYKALLDKSMFVMETVSKKIPEFFMKKFRGQHDFRSDFDVLMEKVQYYSTEFFKSLTDAGNSLENNTTGAGGLIDCLKPFARTASHIYSTWSTTGITAMLVGSYLLGGTLIKGMTKLIFRSVWWLGKRMISSALEMLISERKLKRVAMQQANRRISRLSKMLNGTINVVKKFSDATSKVVRSLASMSVTLTKTIGHGIVMLNSTFGSIVSKMNTYLKTVYEKISTIRIRSLHSAKGPSSRAKVKGVGGLGNMKLPSWITKSAKFMGAAGRLAGRVGPGIGQALLLYDVYEGGREIINTSRELDSYTFDHLSPEEKKKFDAEMMRLAKKSIELTREHGVPIPPNVYEKLEIYRKYGKKKEAAREPQGTMEGFLPQFAKGGVVTGDTLARIGEGSSPEMVLPLDPAMHDLAEQIGLAIVKNYGPFKESLLNITKFNFFRKNKNTIDNILTDVFQEFFNKKDDSSASKSALNKQLETARYKMFSLLSNAPEENTTTSTTTTSTGTTVSTSGVSGKASYNGPTGNIDPSKFTPLDSGEEWLKYQNQNATRDKPLDDDLIQSMSILKELGLVAHVISGGQDAKGHGTKRTGSTEHDHGNAADIKLWSKEKGRFLSWVKDPDEMATVVALLRGNGASSFGAGPGYMNPETTHVGMGRARTWGTNGRTGYEYPALRHGFNNPLKLTPKQQSGPIADTTPKATPEANIKQEQNETIIDSLKKTPISDSIVDKNKKDMEPKKEDNVTQMLDQCISNMNKTCDKMHALNTSTLRTLNFVV